MRDEHTSRIIAEIKASELTRRGISSLADRPNAREGQYGAEGLSPTQLKARFDLLAVFLAERINELAGRLASREAGAYIGIELDGMASLADLVASFASGEWADLFRIGEGDAQKTLASALLDMESAISNIRENEEALAHGCLLRDRDENKRYTYCIQTEGGAPYLVLNELLP